MTCPDLCTKAKCEELEQRIIQLETIVEQLKQINIEGSLIGENLNLTVFNNFWSDTKSVDLSDFCTDTRLDLHIASPVNGNPFLSHLYIPNVSVDLNLIEFNNQYSLDAVVTVDTSSGIDSITWSKTDFDFQQVFLDVTQEGNQTELFVSVKINDVVRSDTALFTIDNNNNQTINIDGSVANKQLFLTVATDSDIDTAIIDLPFVTQDDFDYHVSTKVNDSDGHEYENTINIDGIYENERLYLTVATDSSQDTATILISIDETINNYFNDIVNYNIDLLPAINAIENCCQRLITENNQNQALLDALYYLIELRTGQLENLNNEILNELRVNYPTTDYKVICEKEALGNETTSKFFFNTSQITETQNTKQGILGIADLINKTNKALSIVESKLCEQSLPDFNFVTQKPKYCDANPTIEQYLESTDNFNWFKTVVEDFKNNPDNEIDSNEDSVSVTSNFNVYLAYMMNLIHQQQRILSIPICDPRSEVVPINVSDRVTRGTRGRHLILHFVDLDNYPKRSANSSYRPIQIPLPINNEDLDWETHFDSMRWIQGNLYCELDLQDSDGNKYTPSVAGFFDSKASAENYFNRVLAVTQLQALAIKSHPTSNPKVNIQRRETRPYRAFVMNIDNNGNTVCELKLVPPID